MLTWSKPDGRWGLVNMDLKDVPSWLYGHIMKLHHYEKTGLSPDQVEDLQSELSELSAYRVAISLADAQKFGAANGDPCNTVETADGIDIVVHFKEATAHE